LSKHLINMNTYFAISQLDPLISFSGSADFYFRSNLNRADNPLNGARMASQASFVDVPEFSTGVWLRSMHSKLKKYE
jgi:hypothetical protein